MITRNHMAYPSRKLILIGRLMGIALLLALWPFAGAASSLPLRFEQLNVEQGLPQESALAILQDRHGFMWIGTVAGLARYDGYTMKLFKNAPGDPNSLSDNFVTTLYESPDGQLWAGTRGGLNRYLPDTQQFVPYAIKPRRGDAASHLVVNAIVGDGQEDLWLGTDQGLLHLATASGQVIENTHEPNRADSLIDDKVLSLAHLPNNDLLIGTAGGLDRLTYDSSGSKGNTGNATFRHIGLPGNPSARPLSNNVRSIAVDAAGKAWIGTASGLKSWQAGQESALPMQSGALDALNGASIARLYLDRSGQLWIATDIDGLKRLDIKDNTVQEYRHVEADNHSLASDHINTLFEDRAGALWVGTWFAGASRVDLASGGFERITALPGASNSMSSNQVDGIAGDSHGNIYFATQNGLDRLDAATGAMQVLRHNAADPHSVDNNRISLIVPESPGPWWIGTESGTQQFDPVSGKFTPFPLGGRDLDGDVVQMIIKDRAGTIWFASHDGLHRKDPKSQTVQTYLHDANDPNSLVENRTSFVFEDHQDRLWVGTSSGLELLDRATGRFTHYHNAPADPDSLSHDRVHNLFEDSHNRLWIGTAGGLNLLQTGAEGKILFRRYTTADGLAADAIGSILEDDKGLLWISTTAGISRFDPAAGKFKNYTDKDGLIVGSYFINSAYKAADGNLYFGGINGVAKFRPENIKENPIAPQVAITDLLVLNQSILKGQKPEGVALSGNLQGAPILTVPHSDAVFSIEFAALHFADPARNQYAYQLEGFDKDWVYTDAGKRFATYTNLDPGHYIFHVKASNKDGVWNETGVRMEIIIKPPFWLTWWFRSIVVAGLISLAYLAYRIRVRQLLLQTTALEQEVYARTREVVQQKEAIEKQKQEAERQKESVEQAHHNISVISEIGRQLTAKLEIEAIMDTLYRNVNELMDASVFGIGLYRAEQEIIEVPYAMERDVRYDPYVRDARENNQMAVWCIRNKKEIFINNLEAEHTKYIDNLELTSSTTNLGQLSDGSKPTTPRSMLYVPVMLNERVLGTICVHSFQEYAYQQVHLDMLRTLATYVAVAFDNAEAYKRLGLAQQRLVAQEKMAALGSLVAGVAHELNTPIGNGMLTASSLQERTDEMATKLHDPTLRRSDLVAFVSLCQDAATLIMRGLKSAADLINSFKQVAVDQTSAQRRLHNLEKTCLEIVATMSSKVRKAGHAITVDIPPDIEIDGYPGAFGQVITNFTDNALLHAYEGTRGGHMRLTAKRIGNNKVRVQYSDDGIGIADTNLKRIFDPFYTTKLGKGGSGLGLNISYNIVTSLLGGDITVTSIVGQGTTFTLDLPLQAPIESQQ